MPGVYVIGIVTVVLKILLDGPAITYYTILLFTTGRGCYGSCVNDIRLYVRYIDHGY